MDEIPIVYMLDVTRLHKKLVKWYRRPRVGKHFSISGFTLKSEQFNESRIFIGLVGLADVSWYYNETTVQALSRTIDHEMVHATAPYNTVMSHEETWADRFEDAGAWARTE